MKPIRNYSDGEWLLLLWAFVLLFLAAGLFLGSTAVTIVAVLGALGAGYTTFIYLRANDYSLPFLPARSKTSDDASIDGEYDGEYEYDDEADENVSGPAPGAASSAPVVDSFERPAMHAEPQRPDAPTSPDLSEGDTR